jgi:hypothetical protein
MPTESSLPTWMMLCGIGMLVWLFIRTKLSNRRHHSRLSPVIAQFKHNANAQLGPVVFDGTKSLGAPREVLQWQVELHDLARELKAELDSKLIAVRYMTEIYDQAANRLAEMVAIVQVPSANVIDTPAAQMLRLAQAGFSDQQIAEQFAVEPEFIATLVKSPKA